MSAGLEAASREDLLALTGLLQRQEQGHRSEIAELRAADTALIEANAALVKRVAELERKIGRNSGNSNMPPSTDVFGRLKGGQSAADEAGVQGSRAGANGLGILLGFRGVMVHDAYFQHYNGYPEARRQLCVAHVVRELTAQGELYPQQRWACQLRWVLSWLIKHADHACAEGLDHIQPERIAPLMRSYHRGVADGLARHPRTSETGKQPDATNLLERLRDHAHQYLLFTTDLHVPPTNNLAERDQRPVKTQVKISGCHQPESGARNRLDVRSSTSRAPANTASPLSTRYTRRCQAPRGCHRSPSQPDQDQLRG